MAYDWFGLGPLSLRSSWRFSLVLHLQRKREDCHQDIGKKITFRPRKTSTSCAVFGTRKIHAYHDNLQSFADSSSYWREGAIDLIVLDRPDSPRRFKGAFRPGLQPSENRMREILLTLVIVTKQQSANVSVNGGPKTRAGVMVRVG